MSRAGGRTTTIVFVYYPRDNLGFDYNNFTTLKGILTAKKHQRVCSLQASQWGCDIDV